MEDWYNLSFPHHINAMAQCHPIGIAFFVNVIELKIIIKMLGEVKHHVKTILHSIILIDTATGIKYLQDSLIGRLNKTWVAPHFIVGNAVFCKIETLYTRTIISGHKTLGS